MEIKITTDDLERVDACKGGIIEFRIDGDGSSNREVNVLGFTEYIELVKLDNGEKL